MALAVGLCAIVLGVLVPRAAGISSLPTTDEGYYAYYALRMSQSLLEGHGLPADGFLMIYPLMSSWAFQLPANPVVILRLIDLAVSAVAGILLLVMMKRESRSLICAAVVGTVFLLTMNWAGFVQNGFKNSIFLAYIPLLFAVILTQTDRTLSRRRLFMVGGLVALGVLIREPFACYALLAVGTLWIRQGFRSALWVAAGGVATSLAVLIPLLLLRGGYQNVQEAYLSAGGMFDSLQGERGTLFVNSAITWAKGSILALAAAGVGLAVLMACGFRAGGKTIWSRLLFWIAVAFIPLIEPAMKIGFPYHFASALPGLAGLCAFAWSHIQSRAALTAFTIAFLCAACALLHQEVSWKVRHLPQNASDAVRVARNGWSAEELKSSNYLIAADLIKHASSPEQTLSTSGFMFALFPLSQRSPPSPKLADLTLALIDMDMDARKLTVALRDCPPDVVMTTTRTEFPGAELIEEAISQSGLFKQVGTVPVDANLSYGTFGGTVYARISPQPSICRL